MYSMSQQLCHRQSEADLEEENRYLAKQELKQRNTYEPAERTRQLTQTVKQTFSLAEGYRLQNSAQYAASPL